MTNDFLHHPKSIFLLLLLLAATGLYAQQPPAETPVPVPQAVPEPPDTTPFVVTLAFSPEVSAPADDTLPDALFRQYDPARHALIDWGTLGNMGTAARPLLFETVARRGFHTGIRGFDIYALDAANLRFYRNTRAFSQVAFSQGRVQDENALHAQLSKTFDGGLNFSLEYKTIKNVGQFRQQATSHNALSMGFWYPYGKRYDAFLMFNNNYFRQKENGGIVTDTIFGSGQFNGPINAEIRLPDEEAVSRHAGWTLQLVQHLKFTGGDSLRRVFRATHVIGWTSQTYKFSDPALDNDSAFFGPFLTDLRGIRHYLELGKLDNTFVLKTFKPKSGGRTADALSVGLAHSLVRLRQEPQSDSIISNLFLTGQLSLTPSERFLFSARGELGLLENFGEYLLQGDLQLGLGKAGILRGSLTSRRVPPGLLNERLYVSFRPVWNNNDFAKPLENTLSASYALPALGLELTGRTHLVNNYLYFDQAGLAAQTSAPLQVAQLMVRENFRLGVFRFDNTFALQQTNRDDVLRLPRWFSKNSVYFSGKIFRKRMQTNFGFDFRINGEFRPDAYNPLSWQFQLQDTLAQKPYPWFDAFFAFKVQSFRFYFRYENLYSLLEPGKVFYQTAWHPQPFAALRFGITWRFMDGKQANNTPNTPATPNNTPLGSGTRGRF